MITFASLHLLKKGSKLMPQCIPRPLKVIKASRMSLCYCYIYIYFGLPAICLLYYSKLNINCSPCCCTICEQSKQAWDDECYLHERGDGAWCHMGTAITMINLSHQRRVI